MTSHLQCGSCRPGEIAGFAEPVHSLIASSVSVRRLRFSTSVRRSKKHLAKCDWIRFDRQIWVETRRLDDWCSEANLTTVDLVWTDAMG